MGFVVIQTISRTRNDQIHKTPEMSVFPGFFLFSIIISNSTKKYQNFTVSNIQVTSK